MFLILGGIFVLVSHW